MTVILSNYLTNTNINQNKRILNLKKNNTNHNYTDLSYILILPGQSVVINKRSVFNKN